MKKPLWASMALTGLLLAAQIGLTALPVEAATYLVYEQWGGTWQDANKTSWNTEDDLMCWAATASNVLAWARWGTPTYNTGDTIFKHFQDHWTDNVGYIWIGYKYWFDGSTSPYSTLSVVDVPGGGNFYPTLNFADYYAGASRGNLLAGIDALMHKGYGVGLTISNGSTYSHAITTWGFDFDLVDGVKNYTRIYVTDSDDGILGLRTYPLIYKDLKWYLSGGYNGWRITNYQALALQPALGVAAPAPILPSWLLLASGCGLLLILGQRRRQPDEADL